MKIEQDLGGNEAEISADLHLLLLFIQVKETLKLKHCSKLYSHMKTKFSLCGSSDGCGKMSRGFHIKTPINALPLLRKKQS